MRFLREAVVIYRFLSAIKALITVISHSLLANAVLMAPVSREGDHSVPLAAGLQLPPGRVSDTLGFGAARWVTGRQAAVLPPGRTPREASLPVGGGYAGDRSCDAAQDTHVAWCGRRCCWAGGCGHCACCAGGHPCACARTQCPELGPIAGRMPGHLGHRLGLSWSLEGCWVLCSSSCSSTRDNQFSS